MVRQLASTMLGALGHDVVEAASGAAALRVVGEQEVDLVLTDLEMPGMSGEQLAGELHKRFGGIPVLFMSARPRAPVGGRFLRKPFSAMSLDTVICRTLAESAPFET